MTEYYYIEPVFVDPLGIGYSMDEVTSTPQLEWWPSDDLVQSEKGYLVTEKAKTILHKHELTGFETSEIIAGKADEFEPSNRSLPELHLLEITGDPYEDDFGMGYRYNEKRESYGRFLIVSDQSKYLLDRINFDCIDRVEKIDEENSLSSDCELESAIKLFFEKPTKRNRAKVFVRASDRKSDLPLHPDTEIERQINRLPTLLAREYENEEVMSLVEEYSGDPPSEENAVNVLVTFLEDHL